MTSANYKTVQALGLSPPVVSFSTHCPARSRTKVVSRPFSFNLRASFSPDSKWLAYIAQEEGRRQVFVSPYSDPNVKFLVSGEEGGTQPVWSPDGAEIFYRRGDQMMVISVQIEPTFTSSKPRVLFEGNYFSSANSPNLQYYDLHPKTGEFLMIKSAREQTQINVVLNWFEELKRLVPTN